MTLRITKVFFVQQVNKKDITIVKLEHFSSRNFNDPPKKKHRIYKQRFGDCFKPIPGQRFWAPKIPGLNKTGVLKS